MPRPAETAMHIIPGSKLDSPVQALHDPDELEWNRARVPHRHLWVTDELLDALRTDAATADFLEQIRQIDEDLREGREISGGNATEDRRALVRMVNRRRGRIITDIVPETLPPTEEEISRMGVLWLAMTEVLDADTPRQCEELIAWWRENGPPILASILYRSSSLWKNELRSVESFHRVWDLPIPDLAAFRAKRKERDETAERDRLDTPEAKAARVAEARAAGRRPLIKDLLFQAPGKW